MSFIALLLFFFLDYVRPTSYIPGLLSLHLNSLVPLLAIGGSLANWKPRTGPRPVGEPSNDAMIFGFLGLIAIGAVTAEITERVFNVFVAVFGYVAIYWALTQQVVSVERAKTVMKAMLLAHLLVAALNPVIFTDPDVRHYVTNDAFLGDGNDLALSVNIVIPFCLFLLTESKNARQRGFWLFALVVCLASVVLTKSRGGTIALACVGLYYWSKSERKVMTAGLAAVLGAVILVMAPPSYFDRMSQIADSQEGSAQARIQAWTAGTRMAMDNPLTGVGAGHFPLEYGTRYRVSELSPAHNAHSIYFMILGELGFPGVILLIAIIIRNLTANGRLAKQLGSDPSAGTERRLLWALNAGLIAYATGGAFLSAAYYPHMYVLAGLHEATRHLIRVRLRTAVPVTATTTALALPPAVTATPGLLAPYGISPEWTGPRPRRRLTAPSTAIRAK